MKSIHSLVVCLGMLFISGHSLASDTHKGYCATAETTADIVQCLSIHHKAEQEKMTELFEAMAIAYDGNQDYLNDLKSNQDLWLGYKDNLCALEGRLYEGGSLQRVQELDCQSRLSAQRNNVIKGMLSALDSAEIPEYSNPPRWVNVLVRDYPETFWGFGTAQMVDTDCDGQDENIVRGLGEGGKMSLAIADSMPTGRPKISILNFDDRENCIISSDYTMTKLPQIKPVDDKEQFCSQIVTVKTKTCGDFALRYDTTLNQYTIEKQE